VGDMTGHILLLSIKEEFLEHSSKRFVLKELLVISTGVMMVIVIA
jgi:hypothetical protein